MERLAALYVREVRKQRPHGPYRLCGHSFGGLVVYEMAILLQSAGELVDLVALIDTLHPAFTRNMSPTERRRFQATYLADRVAKYARNLAGGRIDRAARDALVFVCSRLRRRAWALARSLIGRLRWSALDAIRSDGQMLSRCLAAL